MSKEDSIAKIEALLEEHERRIKLLEQKIEGKGSVPVPVVAQVQVPAPPPVPSVPSVRHFILEKAPTDDVQRTLAIGYYFEKHTETKVFNVKDIEKGFVDAREKVPGNVADKILKNVWKGNMMQVQEEKDGLKAYALTNAGMKSVESGFK